MTCEQFEELSGAYVLDAVTPDERQEAEAHLAQCTKCTRLVQELRSAVAFLPLSIPQVNPPPSLESRVISAIQEDIGLTATPAQRSRIAQPSRRTRRRRWLPRVLVAAAVLMFCLLGGMGALSFSLSHQVTSLQQQLAHVINQQQAASTKAYKVLGLASAQGASGTLLYFPSQNVTVLIMHGLPQLTGNQVYQGWLIQTKNSKPVMVTSIGLLNNLDGTASLAFPGNVIGYEVTAISIEHGPRASIAPSQQVIAEGSLQKATSAT
jgi:anti-sigma-K factor RskA